MKSPVDAITKFYLESHRFNGYPFVNLKQELGMNFHDAFNFVRENVNNGTLTVVFGDMHPNPHIKAFSDEPQKNIITKLNQHKDKMCESFKGYSDNDSDNSIFSKIGNCVIKFETGITVCLYPTRLHLESIVNPDDYRDCPYTYEMALGAGQLEFRYFELTVLEFYRNDPRYYYWCDDINGRISIHDEYYHGDSMAEKDKVLLQTFGFAYNNDTHRAVTTLVYYISKLSPEHQQVWKNRELNSAEYRPHPDYYRNSILGDWGEKIPVCTAFLMELKIINQMCVAMGKPALFRKDFDGDDKPRNFSFLVRPTHKEYYDFVGLLDKMMSDNINKKFFENDISCEDEETRPDGKTVVKPKGTIQLLEEWINKYYHPQDQKPMDDVFKAFRKVRKERQRPAHAIDDDRFDQKYFADQRQILKEAYGAVRTIRLVFANHSAVKAANIDISQTLYEGKIWTC